MPSAVANFAHLRQMFVNFLAGFMNVGEWRAGKLELAARLQRDVAKTFRVGERNDVPALENSLPAKAVTQPFEQGTDGALALVGNGPQAVGQKRKLLMLGAYAPISLRLAARTQRLNQLRPAGNRRSGILGLGCRAAHDMFLVAG